MSFAITPIRTVPKSIATLNSSVCPVSVILLRLALQGHGHRMTATGPVVGTPITSATSNGPCNGQLAISPCTVLDLSFA